jgi:hypothetical protein
LLEKIVDLVRCARDLDLLRLECEVCRHGCLASAAAMTFEMPSYISSADRFRASSPIDTIGCGHEVRKIGLLQELPVHIGRPCRIPDVTIVAVATPFCSSWTLSWRLHDVQEPQSPNAVSDDGGAVGKRLEHLSRRGACPLSRFY